jgi:NSS family neurotransmitter:Na+ symporter
MQHLFLLDKPDLFRYFLQILFETNPLRMQTQPKEAWGSRIGLVLAAAGSAIGIGNLLRFPSQAAQNGGGAFMIPYLLSLLLFGLPLMWVAWTVGRYGGRFGHSSLPGMFDAIWRNPSSKFLGVLGIGIPLVFCIYYTYIESWCLAYAFFSLTGEYSSTAGRTVDLAVFLGEYLGDATSQSYFTSIMPALGFMIIVVLVNVWVLARGVARGIELLAKIAIPLLLLFCFALAVRVLTIGDIEGSAFDGLSFLWTPDFSALSNPNVWIAAAGQIFFTLGIGFGALECFASYVRAKEDIALASLTTASTNEFVEIIFGSMIAIPAAAIFFGPGQIEAIAQNGTFSIGMVSMPEILRSTPGTPIFGTIWFLLLFFAAFTSSVAIAQPVMAFLQDEVKLSRPIAAILLGLLWILGTFPIIFFYKYGVLDEFDFWAGTIGLVVLAIVEVILFAWMFGIGKGWEELHEGAMVRVPRVFMFVIKYITPVALIAIFLAWAFQANLTPAPKILWGVAEREKFSGRFLSQPLSTVSAEERTRRLAAIEQIEFGIRQAVEASQHDLSAWAEIALTVDGEVKIQDYAADPTLERAMDADAFQRWLELQGFRYEEKNTEGRNISRPATVTIRLEALHRAPYIWLARVVIAGFFVAFLLMIGIVWKWRQKPEVVL